jgi:DNA mismatch repair protein MutS2
VIYKLIHDEKLKNLDWYELLEHLRSFATSELAKSRLAGLQPLPNKADAEGSFKAIFELQTVLSAGERPFLESLDFFSPWYERLKRESILTTTELRDVRRFCVEAVALNEVLRPFQTPWIKTAKSQMLKATEPLGAIDQVMTPTGDIRMDASETLHHLFKEKSQQTKSLQNVLDRLIKQHDMETILQERFVTTREGRWVIPVRSGMQGFFPGIIHASSQSKQTVFMEPDEVVPLNNRLRQLESAIDEEVERILTQLSHYLRSMLPEFHRSQAVMLDFDIRFAQARLAVALSANAVHFSEDRLHLNDVRHPLLVFKNQGMILNVIGNTVKLDREKRILLLSGPNAGGKTVLLKSIALACQMARCGLLVCADENSSIPFFNQFYIAVGDAQSVDAEMSTFAAHLHVLNQAANAKHTSAQQDLLLIDEICGSTDPEEGSALARAFIESYAKAKVFAIITSHLGPLKTGWTPESGVINGSLEYNAKTGQPTYQFFSGVPGSSLAIQTAKRVGVSEQIVARAFEHLSPDAIARHRALNDIEGMREEMQNLRTRLNDELKDAKKNQSKYHELVQLFKREKDLWMDRAVKKAQKKIDELIEKNSVDTIFKKHEKLLSIKTDLPEIVKSTSAPHRKSQAETVEEFEKIYPSGSLVFITTLNQDGVIQGRSNAKGEIPVVANSMRLSVPWTQLRAPQNTQSNPTQNILRRASGVSVTLHDSERVVDIRGKNSEDAVSYLEVQLDAAALNREDRVKVVHGHGTEVLKKSIRAHLSRSIYVKKWKAGGPDSGGDGITWAELKD